MSPEPADTNVGATVARPFQAAGSGDFPFAGSSSTFGHILHGFSCSRVQSRLKKLACW